MAPATDPVASGFVKSFARPGGNITGVANMFDDLTAKTLDIVRVAFPDVRKIGKDSVVERLANCETKGRPDASSVIIIDTNNKASIGKLQFQAETVVNYTKLIEGRTIDRKGSGENRARWRTGSDSREEDHL